MEVCATMITSLPIDWPISIFLDVNDGTGIFLQLIIIVFEDNIYIIKAQNGFDYRSTSSYETFPYGTPNSTERCLNILILDDNILEDNENFTVTFTNPFSEITLGRTTTVITITDDDSNARIFMTRFISILNRCESIPSKHSYCQ